MPKIDSRDYRDYVIREGRFIGEFEQMFRNVEDPWGMCAQVNDLKNQHLLTLVRQCACEAARVLDLGCGLGALTARLRDALPPQAEIWACDISETAVQKAGAAHSGIHFFTHDLSRIRDIPFPQASFDLAVMAETMWYILPWLDEVFAGLHSLLRPGGHLLLLQYFLKPEEQSYGKEIVQRPEDLRRFVQNAGFEVRHELHLDPDTAHDYLLWATRQEA